MRVKFKGFTLLELIVVIVVLGILAMLSVPLFTTIKNKSADSIALKNAQAVQRDFDAQQALAASDPTILPSASATWSINGVTYSYVATSGGVPNICTTVSKSEGCGGSTPTPTPTPTPTATSSAAADPILNGVGMNGTETSATIAGAWDADQRSNWNANYNVLVFDVTAGKYSYVKSTLWPNVTGLTNLSVSGYVATYTSTYGASSGHTLRFAKTDGPFGNGDIVSMSWV